jgi:hypothetical protein
MHWVSHFSPLWPLPILNSVLFHIKCNMLSFYYNCLFILMLIKIHFISWSLIKWYLFLYTITVSSQITQTHVNIILDRIHWLSIRWSQLTVLKKYIFVCSSLPQHWMVWATCASWFKWVTMPLVYSCTHRWCLEPTSHGFHLSCLASKPFCRLLCN